MLPWAHLGLGYLLYSSLRRGDGARPAPLPTFALALATQAPDLVDKPLSWHLAVLPTGRSLAHSVVAAAAVTLLAVGLARRYRAGEVGEAFAIGYWSHLFGDAVWPLAAGEFSVVPTFFWPLVRTERVEHDMGIVEFMLSVEGSVQVFVGLLIAAAAAVVWVADGTPGAPRVRWLDPRIS